MQEWIRAGKGHTISNLDLFDEKKLRVTLKFRVRNFVQSRHRDLTTAMCVPQDWLDWFNSKKEMKVNIFIKLLFFFLLDYLDLISKILSIVFRVISILK
jgi:hypothetical protein